MDLHSHGLQKDVKIQTDYVSPPGINSQPVYSNSASLEKPLNLIYGFGGPSRI